MSFAAPLFLWGIVPFAALVVYSLRRSQASTAVPFVRLWTSNHPPRTSTSRRFHRPPPATIFALLAILLAILAAARPVPRARATNANVLIIVDRGYTSDMSSASWSALARHVQQVVQDSFDVRRVELRGAPAIAESSVEASGISSLIERNPPTAVDSQGMLDQTITDATRDRRFTSILVFTEQSPSLHDPRVHVEPLRSMRHGNLAIEHVGVSMKPQAADQAEAMVQVRNDGWNPSAPTMLTIEVDGTRSQQRPIDLPPSGSERNYFVDLPKVGDAIRVSLDVADDKPADNIAYVARETTWPRLEAHSPVPAEVRRLIETYSKLRPTGPRGQAMTLGIVDAAVAAPANDEPAAIIAAFASSWTPTTRPISGQLSIVDHPAVRHVNDWPAALDGATIASLPAGESWQPIASVDGHPFIAFRDQPARQIWIGFRSPRWSQSDDFVIFWTDLIDWLANGSTHLERNAWSSLPVEKPSPEWSRDAILSGPAMTAEPTTGIYRHVGTGELRAMSIVPNQSPRRPAPQPTTGPTQSLSAPPSMPTESAATSVLAILAMVCLLGAVATWNR